MPLLGVQGDRTALAKLYPVQICDMYAVQTIMIFICGADNITSTYYHLMVARCGGRVASVPVPFHFVPFVIFGTLSNFVK